MKLEKLTNSNLSSLYNMIAKYREHLAQCIRIAENAEYYNKLSQLYVSVNKKYDIVLAEINKRIMDIEE